MATVVAAMVARARRDIQHYFFSADAVRPERAVRFEPHNRVQRRQFELMRSRGIVREGERDRYWIDVVAYDRDMRGRHARVRWLLLAVIAALAVGAILAATR